MIILTGLILFICIVPFLLILYFICYPKKWQDKKTIFGVRNREIFKIGDNEKTVDEIVLRIRNLATKILISSCCVAGLIMFIPEFTIMVVAYTAYIFLAIVVIYIPYAKGNAEMKSFKRKLGIEEKSGIRVADMKSITSSRAVNVRALVIPAALSGVALIFSLLYDFGVINIGSSAYKGSFALTIFCGVFLFQAVLFVLIAILMDSIRNEVISGDSDVNANYNRAKKKLWSNLWVQLNWLNFATIVVMIIGFILGWAELGMIICCVVWMLICGAIMALFVRNNAKLNSRYEFEPIEDDNDSWIYGLFYYNPKDKRLNVEKRTGVGSTINMAHPAGKVIGVITALILVGTLASIVWAVIISSTPVDLVYEDGKIICHQLYDVYEINVDEIEQAGLIDDASNFKALRVGGVGTDKLYIGNFVVNGENCKVFMDLTSGSYIRIKAADKVYYINDSSDEETREIFRKLGE